MNRIGQICASVVGFGDLTCQRPYLLQIVERLFRHTQDRAKVLLFRPDAVALEGCIARWLVGVVGGVHNATCDNQAVVAWFGGPDNAGQRTVDELLPGLILVLADQFANTAQALVRFMIDENVVKRRYRSTI